jgi:hypothetical protein
MDDVAETGERRRKADAFTPLASASFPGLTPRGPGLLPSPSGSTLLPSPPAATVPALPAFGASATESPAGFAIDPPRRRDGRGGAARAQEQTQEAALAPRGGPGIRRCGQQVLGALAGLPRPASGGFSPLPLAPPPSNLSCCLVLLTASSFTAVVLDCSSLVPCVPRLLHLFYCCSASLFLFFFCECLDLGFNCTCTANVSSNKGFCLLFNPSLSYNLVPRTHEPSSSVIQCPQYTIVSTLSIQ